MSACDFIKFLLFFFVYLRLFGVIMVIMIIKRMVLAVYIFSGSKYYTTLTFINLF